MTFVSLSDDQLQDLETRFGRIHEHTPAPPARSRWAKADAPAPEPPYQVVFRPCNPGEWDNIKAQSNDPKRVHQAPGNLAKATIVAVSFDGKVAVHPGDMSSATDNRLRSEVWALYDALLRSWPGVPENMTEPLAELNKGASAAVEKG